MSQGGAGDRLYTSMDELSLSTYVPTLSHKLIIKLKREGLNRPKGEGLKNKFLTLSENVGDPHVQLIPYHIPHMPFTVKPCQIQRIYLV